MAGRVYLTKEQEAERLKVTTRSLDRFCTQGFPFFLIGGRRRFVPEESDRYLAERTLNPASLHVGRQAAIVTKAA